MMGLLSWLAGTHAGQRFLAFGAVLAALFYALCKAFSLGKTLQKSAQDQATLAAYKEREESDEDVSKLDPAAARHELSRWVQHD